MKKSAKYRILILLIPLVLVIGIIAAIAAGPKEVERFYESNRKTSLDDLKQRGNEYVMRGEPDSAMACYSIIVNAYSPKMSNEDKSICAAAYNNIGYLYFMEMNDFAQAYYYHIRALEVAEECDYTNGMVDIYLNMGNVFANYENFDEACSNYRKAMDYAVINKNHEKFLICYANLLRASFTQFSSGKAAEDAKLLDPVSIPAETPLRTTAGLLHDACLELANGNLLKGDSLLAQAAEKVDSRFTPERFVHSIQEMRAASMIRNGRFTDAAAIYRNCAAICSKAADYDLLGVAYAKLSECYEQTGMHDSAIYYRNKRHEVEDTLYSNKKFGMIKNLQSSYRMKKTDEEIKELVRKRDTQQLVIAIVSVGAALVLILSILLFFERRRLRTSNEELYNRVEDLLHTQDLLREASRQEKETGFDESSHSEPAGTQDAGQKEGAVDDSPERKELVDRKESDAILEKVLKFLDTSPDIYTPGFSIDSLCAAIDSKTRYVSYVINDRLGKNFNTLLSEYRIREACRRLSDPTEFGNITIEGVGLSLGFRSRSNFAAHFKKQTGLSPNEFLKIAQKKARQNANQVE